jgi:vacuolar-type H+-ATPase subunit E/Vma4
MTFDPEEMLREAEEEIEAWLCQLDAEWKEVLADAERHADRIRTGALDEAEEILDAARAEAERLLSEADERAGEHVDVIRALTTAESEAVGEELAGLREAVTRLRAELSRVVDAAFDAIPAVEATADAIDRAMEHEPIRRGLLRRLLRR